MRGALLKTLHVEYQSAMNGHVEVVFDVIRHLSPPSEDF
jgi:hypothetical protein